MGWFKKKSEPKSERRELYKVVIQTEVLVKAVNKMHAVNLTKDIREGMYVSYRDNQKLAVHEADVKATKL